MPPLFFRGSAYARCLDQSDQHAGGTTVLPALSSADAVLASGARASVGARTYGLCLHLRRSARQGLAARHGRRFGRLSFQTAVQAGLARFGAANAPDTASR